MNGWPQRPRVLLSYAYLKHDARLPVGVDIIVDSGAFTVHSSGKTIDVHAYVEYLNRERGRFDAAFGLDVIGDAAASMRNYAIMADGLHADVAMIPVWHQGSPISVLESLMEQWDYIAVGGLVSNGPGKSRNVSAMRAAIAAHKLARDHGVRLHGLGVTGNEQLRLPWFSVDSSSWTIPQRRPVVYLAQPNGRLKSYTRGTTATIEQRQLLHAYGLDALRFGRYGSSAAGHIGRETAKRETSLAIDATVRSYMWADARSPHGTRIYLAASTASLPTIVAAHQRGAPFTSQPQEASS